MKLHLVAMTLALAVVPAVSPGQDADPFAAPARKAAPKKAAGADPKLEGPANLDICYETFSLPLTDAAGLLRETLPDSKLYDRLLQLVTDKKARQESLSVIRTRSGQRAITEAITETIYPTEWEPAQLPNTLGVKIDSPSAEGEPPQPPDLDKLDRAPSIRNNGFPATPATPTAFETRNTGHTLEVDPLLDADRRHIDLSISPEHVDLAGESVHGQGLNEIRMPEFESQKISVAVTVRSGIPHLLGTVSPPPHSKANPDSANTTWFAFVTARVVAPE